jgi:hypothetical protein
MPIMDRGFEPILAGKANCYRINTMSSQYSPLDHRCNFSNPQSVQKRTVL